MKASAAYFENPDVESLFNPNELRITFSDGAHEEAEEKEYTEYELLESVIKPISYSEFVNSTREGQ
jgi:hypothetical protein